MTRPVRIAHLLVALPVAAALCLGSCADGPDELLAQARRDFAAGDYLKARSALAAALHERPGDAEILLLLAQAHLRQGDADGTERVLGRLQPGTREQDVARIRAQIALQRSEPQQALRLLGNDRSAVGLGLRGDAHVALKNGAAAIAAYDDAMRSGGDAKLGAKYARYLLNQRDVDRTAGVLALMQAREPRAYETLVLAADLAVARGDQVLAIESFRKIVKAYPDRVAPMLALADMYGEQGKFDAIAPLLDKAGAIEPDNQVVMVMRLRLMAEKQQWRAIRDMLQTRESGLEPGSEVAMIYAKALLGLGQAGQARVLAARALLMQPDNHDAAVLMAQAQLAGGDASSAWDALRPLIDATLAPPEVLMLAARAAKAAKAPEAAALAARVQPAALARVLALAEQGEGALERKDWAGAERAYKALLLQGEDPDILARLAFACSQSRHGRDAVRYADRALAADPSPHYAYVAGLARLDAGVDLAGAVALLQRAAAAAPDNTEIAQALAKAKAAAG